MSLLAIMLRTAYKLSGAKKAFSLPEEELLKVIKKQNRHRAFLCPQTGKPVMRRSVSMDFPAWS